MRPDSSASLLHPALRGRGTTRSANPTPCWSLPNDVVDGRLGAELRVQGPGLARTDPGGSLVARVSQVGERQRAADAGLYAGGLKTRVQPVDAQVALVGQACLLIEVPGAVGAGDDAVLAAHALGGVYDDDPVRPAVGGLRRADLHAGRIGAVHARPLHRHLRAT